jgi:hypothetical protein
VPKVHANFIDPETQKRYVVMDFVPGTNFMFSASKGGIEYPILTAKRSFTRTTLMAFVRILHSIIELPTIADIEASTDVLSIRTNAIKVVRVKERFAVKIDP